MKIGIIGAMEIEINKLIKNIKNCTENKVANRTFYTGTINDKQVVVVESGIGLVNAAITTQILIDYYKPDYIINSGIGGSLRDDIKIFDVVISTDCIEYEFDVTCFGYEKGQIPNREKKEFPTSKYLADIIESLNLRLNLHRGRIISSDKFLSDLKKRNELAKIFDASCVEMEGASIAHVCSDNNVECIIIRTISDNATDFIDYQEIEKQSAEISSDIILDILNSL